MSDLLKKTNKIIERCDLPSDYDEMMKTETHHNHALIKDKDGVIRWEADPFIRQLTNDCSMNCIVTGFYEKGNNKNTESYRELYRKMGYSLSGYCDVFYWYVNNDIADEYKQPI